MNNEPVAWIVSHNSYTIKEAAEAMSKLFDEPMIPLYTHPVEEQDESFDRTASHMAGEYVSYKPELTDEEIIESLAELEHEQWMKWADTIMQTEKISDARFARWASCMIPYADLTEEMKEFDREWARKALAILRKAQE